VVNALVANVKHLKAVLNPGTFGVMQIAGQVRYWPVFGERLFEEISDFAHNQEDFFRRYRGQILAVGSFTVGLV
jgi:hypothetical protein